MSRRSAGVFPNTVSGYFGKGVISLHFINGKQHKTSWEIEF